MTGGETSKIVGKVLTPLNCPPGIANSLLSLAFTYLSMISLR